MLNERDDFLKAVGLNKGNALRLRLYRHASHDSGQILHGNPRVLQAVPLFFHQPDGIVHHRIVKFVLQKSENLVGTDQKDRPHRFCQAALPQAERIIELAHQKIAVNYVFPLQNGKAVSPLKAPVNLQLRVVHLDSGYMLSVPRVNLKVKSAGGHAPRHRLHQPLFPQEILQNPSEADKLNGGGLRPHVADVDSLQVVGNPAPVHLDYAASALLLRKIVIQGKISDHVASPRHREDAKLPKHRGNRLSGVKFRHQPGFLKFPDLIRSN